jgi:hypothetical protein
MDGYKREVGWWRGGVMVKERGVCTGLTDKWDITGVEGAGVELGRRKQERESSTELKSGGEKSCEKNLPPDVAECIWVSLHR